MASTKPNHVGTEAASTESLVGVGRIAATLPETAHAQMLRLFAQSLLTTY